MKHTEMKQTLPETAVTKKEGSAAAIPGGIVKRERNYGIDLLRILSMMFVVLLHVLGQGGVLNAARQTGGAHYQIAWLMEIVAYCAVNCFALISGYVGIKSRYTYTHIIMLWLQVFFYMGLITLIFSFVNPGALPSDQIWNVFFPAVKNQYWYFTAYMAMSLFIPVFNYAVDHLPRRQMKAVVILLIVFFSVIPTLFRTHFFGTPIENVFYVSNGNNAKWLSVLYLIGAYISKYDCLSWLRARWCFLIYGGTILLSWCCEFLLERGGVLVRHTSPIILLEALALLLGVSKLHFPKKLGRVITVLAAGSFGVYLIHANPIVWKVFMLNRYTAYGFLPTWEMVISVLAAVLLLYFALTVIDLWREILFRAIRLRRGVEFLEQKITGNLWYHLENDKK